MTLSLMLAIVLNVPQVIQDVDGRGHDAEGDEYQCGILESLKKSGMQVSELPAAEVAKLREKMKPVIAKHTASVGESTVKAVMAEIDKARK